MSSKVYANCGPCQDVAVERNVLIDCATGQPLVFPGANCNTPAWVKSCDPPQPECSLALAMNPITLEVVAVVACVSAGVPTFTQYNLDGTPYTGPQPVAIDKEWAFQSHDMCDNGVSTVTRTDVFLDGSNTPAFQIWQDMLGAVIAAPNVATLTYGACPIPEAAPVPVADGYLVSIPGSSSAPVTFSAAVSSVAVHNLSNNVLQVQFASPVGGNQFHYVAPGGAMTTAFDPGVLIPAVTINNLGALTADVIVNGLRPR